MRTTAKLRDPKLRDLRAVSQLPPRPGAAASATPVRTAGPIGPPPSRSPLRLVWLLDSLPMRALRRLISRFLGTIMALSAYGAVALVIGLASAWYMIEAGSALTVVRDGPWKRWTLAGETGADPYTRAHFARAGWLPLSAKAALYYTASRDSTGEPLYSDCEYTLSGSFPGARRWTLAAYDIGGVLIDPGPGPPVVSSDTALPGPGGTLTISISQSASPGNWLAVSGAARMQLLLTLFGVRDTSAVRSRSGATPHAFRIEKAGCR
jgi:hypothetical protein